MSQLLSSINIKVTQIMPNYTREELANKTATINQMRNNLYHFLRYLTSKGFSEQEIHRRLDRMGKNIAKTILEEKNFIGQDFEEKVITIYSDMFGSKVEITKTPNQFIIEDKKCSLCKYRREDLSISPCEVIPSLVAEICTHMGYPVKRFAVMKSVALGDVSCIHSYDIKERDE